MPTITIVPAAAQQQVPLLDGTFGADRDDDVVRPASPGQARDDLDHVVVGRIDDMGRAERQRRPALRRRRVDRDHRRRPGEDGALDGVEPHAPRPDHDDAAARLGPGRVDDRTEPGDDPAREQGGAVEREVARHDDHLGGVDDDLFREGSRAKPLLDRRPVECAQRPVLVEGERPVAENRLVPAARVTRSTRSDQRHHHAVTDREPSTPGPTPETVPAASCP